MCRRRPLLFVFDGNNVQLFYPVIPGLFEQRAGCTNDVSDGHEIGDFLNVSEIDDFLNENANANAIVVPSLRLISLILSHDPPSLPLVWTPESPSFP